MALLTAVSMGLLASAATVATASSISFVFGLTLITQFVGASTLIQYYAENGRLLYSSFVPASPGDATISFLGIVFHDARIASVRITTGRAAPGADDDEHDVVVMDDFLFGEPQPLR